MSDFMAEDLQFIKKFVIVEFCIVAAVIVCGGLVYGVESCRWGLALVYSGVLLAGAAVAMGIVYQRAEQRLRIFCRR